MKFAALLRSSAEHSPELQGLFVCYKQLKKKIKQLPDGQIHDAGRDGVAAEQEEASFVQIIIADVHHFNDLFIEREEDSVIRLGSIEDAAESASTPADIVQVLKRYGQGANSTCGRPALLSSTHEALQMSGVSAKRESARAVAVDGALEHPSIHRPGEDPQEAPQADRAPGSCTAPGQPAVSTLLLC